MTGVIDKVLQSAVIRGDVPGVVAMAADDDGVVYEGAADSTPIHVRGEDGSWVVTDIDWAQEPEFWGSGHFRYSTPRDYLAFQRMLLGGGALGDTRILEPATVQAAFVNQIGELYFPGSVPTAHPELSADVSLGPDLKWGLGLLLNEQAQPGARAAGSGAWAGLFNTFFWVDPTSRITGAIYSQLLPFADPNVLQLYVDFEQALYAQRR